MPRNRKPRSPRGAGVKVIYILVDGQTEQWYLLQLKSSENVGTVNIKPELPKKATPNKQYQLIKEASKHYDQAIWLVDFDTILKEEREFRSGGKSPLLEFNEYYQELSAIGNVDVLVNTPCLEYWYLLHLENTGRFYQSYSAMEGNLNAVPIQDYSKTRRYYTSGIGIYARLKPNLSEAYRRAKGLGQYDPQNPQQAKAEIYRLFEILEIEL